MGGRRIILIQLNDHKKGAQLATGISRYIENLWAKGDHAEIKKGKKEKNQLTLLIMYSISSRSGSNGARVRTRASSHSLGSSSTSL